LQPSGASRLLLQTFSQLQLLTQLSLFAVPPKEAHFSFEFLSFSRVHTPVFKKGSHCFLLYCLIQTDGPLKNIFINRGPSLKNFIKNEILFGEPQAAEAVLLQHKAGMGATPAARVFRFN